MSVLRSLRRLRILAGLAVAGSFLPAAMAQDVDPPVPLSAILQPDLTTIILTVNEPLETDPFLSAAEDPFVYSLEEVGGLGVEFFGTATVSPADTVTLTLLGPIDPSKNWELVLFEGLVTDLSGNAISSPNNTIPLEIPEIDITLLPNGDVVLNWFDGTLEEASDPNGFFTAVPGATSPFTIPAATVATQSMRIYRTVNEGITSAKAVGLVHMDLPAGASIIANPLNETSGDNHLNKILPLPESAIGATIWRFDTTTQSYGSALQWAGAALGWLSADPAPAWPVLNPGEAFFLELAVPEAITWVGEVPQGSLSNPLPGDGLLAMRSSQFPEQAQLGSPGVGLEFPGETIDTVYILNNGTSSYKEPYQFLGGLGWLSANVDDEGLDGPTIPVGTGFFIQRFTVGSTSWDRTVVVGP